MQHKTIAGLVLAALLVTGSAAAMPGNAVTQAQEQMSEHTNGAAGNTPVETGEQSNASTDEATESDMRDANGSNADRGPPEGVPAADKDKRGPPTEMPEQVPDFVSELHSLIEQQLDGDLTGPLGEQRSDLTPGDGDEESAEDDATATDTSTEDDDATETADDTGTEASA